MVIEHSILNIAVIRSYNIVILSVVRLNVIMLNVVMLNVIMLNVIMLNVVMLNVNMLNVIMLNVEMPNVVAPFFKIDRRFFSVFEGSSIPTASSSSRFVFQKQKRFLKPTSSFRRTAQTPTPTQTTATITTQWRSALVNFVAFGQML
jgi:hypothetical protein